MLMKRYAKHRRSICKTYRYSDPHLLHKFSWGFAWWWLSPSYLSSSDLSRTGFTTWNQMDLPHELSLQTQKHWHDIPKNTQTVNRLRIRESQMRADICSGFGTQHYKHGIYTAAFAFVTWGGGGGYVCSLACHTFWSNALLLSWYCEAPIATSEYQFSLSAPSVKMTGSKNKRSRISRFAEENKC